MLGGSLRLGLLLCLRSLLSRLLLGFLLSLFLLPPSPDSAGRCPDRGAGAGIACDCSNGSASSRPLRTALNGSALWRRLSSLLRRLLLRSLLLFRVRRRRRWSLRIYSCLLLRRSITIAFILELLIRILLISGVCKQADALRRRPSPAGLGGLRHCEGSQQCQNRQYLNRSHIPPSDFLWDKYGGKPLLVFNPFLDAVLLVKPTVHAERLR